MTTPPARRAVARTGSTYQLAEGPHWDPRRGRLSWVDIATGSLWEVDGDDPAVEPRLVLRGSEPLGVAVPHEDGGWLLGRGRGVVLVDDDGVTLEELELEAEGVRMNDGKVDPAGRFWVGSKAHDNAPGRGRLFRLDLDGSAHQVLEGLTITNGLGWSPDGATMYVTDSGAGTIDAYDLDAATGELHGGRSFVALEADLGAPDGLTVDAEGHVWVAVWGGGRVRRYAPDGSLVAEVAVAASHTSSCAFAGRDLATLVITTAWDELEPAQRADEPDAGRVFVLADAGRGLPARAARVVRTGWRLT